jgi:hypothetical protein
MREWNSLYNEQLLYKIAQIWDNSSLVYKRLTPIKNEKRVNHECFFIAFTFIGYFSYYYQHFICTTVFQITAKCHYNRAGIKEKRLYESSQAFSRSGKRKTLIHHL